MRREVWSAQQLMLDPGMATLHPISDEAVEHGEVFTRRWIVDLILDLAGYTTARDLGSTAAVEPACGAGAFLGPMVERLSSSCRARGRSLASAQGSIRAFDLLPRNVEVSRRLVEKILIEDGWDAAEVVAIAEDWVSEGDYLLSDEVPDHGVYPVDRVTHLLRRCGRVTQSTVLCAVQAERRAWRERDPGLDAALEEPFGASFVGREIQEGK